MREGSWASDVDAREQVFRTGLEPATGARREQKLGFLIEKIATAYSPASAGGRALRIADKLHMSFLIKTAVGWLASTRHREISRSQEALSQVSAQSCGCNEISTGQNLMTGGATVLRAEHHFPDRFSEFLQRPWFYMFTKNFDGPLQRYFSVALKGFTALLCIPIPSSITKKLRVAHGCCTETRPI
ncbi:hypothetical protein BDW22DRAFT_804309 [Trametopsis cervina]|nr:hypothetical protein BDW22DRAFT_804309 [Trametopsis cervina]